MGPLYRIGNRREIQPDRRTVKFLAVCKDPRVQRMVLQSASDSVYKSICNAFFNVAENPDVHLSNQQRKKFKRFRPLIEKIIQPKLKLSSKRRAIQRGGGIFLAAVLPAVISTALSFLGSAFLNKTQQA